MIRNDGDNLVNLFVLGTDMKVVFPESRNPPVVASFVTEK